MVNARRTQKLTIGGTPVCAGQPAYLLFPARTFKTALLVALISIDPSSFLRADGTLGGTNSVYKRPIQGPIQVQSIVDLVMNCPPWVSLREDDLQRRKEIMNCLAEIARAQTATLRESFQLIAQIIQGHSAKDTESTLFLINRYVFDVPNEAQPTPDWRGDGWAGIPAANHKVDLLWPFSKRADGKLDLVGIYQGYRGEPYQALDEFDYFEKHFGRRKVGQYGE